MHDIALLLKQGAEEARQTKAGDVDRELFLRLAALMDRATAITNEARRQAILGIARIWLDEGPLGSDLCPSFWKAVDLVRPPRR